MTVALAFKAFAKAIPCLTPFLARSDPSVLKRILAYIRGLPCSSNIFSKAPAVILKRAPIGLRWRSLGKKLNSEPRRADGREHKAVPDQDCFQRFAGGNEAINRAASPRQNTAAAARTARVTRPILSSRMLMGNVLLYEAIREAAMAAFAKLAAVPDRRSAQLIMSIL